MMIDRRSLLKCAGLVPLMGVAPRLARADDQLNAEKADYTLRIATGLVELAPDHIVSTTLYNGQFPGTAAAVQGRPAGHRRYLQRHRHAGAGPLARPDDPERRGRRGRGRLARSCRRTGCGGSPLCRNPSGFRFYHTHVVAGGDLNRGTYTGQAGPVYIEPKNNPGAYDREVFLVLKEFAPAFSRGGDMAMDVLAGEPVKALQEMGNAADERSAGKNQGLRSRL